MIYTQENNHGHCQDFQNRPQPGGAAAEGIPLFEGDEVYIQRVGSAVMLLPKTKDWSVLLASLDMFEPGFRIEREQPKAQQERRLLDTMFDEK